MTIFVFTLILFIASAFAGLIGSLTGLGGGVVLIPLLTLVFKINIHYAIGTSLISVIATSSGAAAAYVKEGITNIRLGMFLELATTSGAIIGAMTATFVSTSFIAVTFGVILLVSAITSFMSIDEKIDSGAKGKFASFLKLNNSFPTGDGMRDYTVKNVAGGFLMMNIAGIVSGLLGIGSGALKVIAMDRVMRIPFKVSTTTSNFMIGVTAAASAGVYLKRGYIDPGLSMPVVLGVLLGALIGSRILFRAETRILKVLFAIVICILAAEMIYNGIKGTL
ncbi:permease [Niastella vici]|uniref:Probable membrane transporter protein n=1 Tax=Niastella vici TaxID=1703345 RepID=A0A1V9G7L3_9BACT|nr:sulfite exporter TauE/SafE family protein [Niastella vici]OQP66567.1 permease [Niastella vici]